jgi:hypothetical protein
MRSLVLLVAGVVAVMGTASPSNPPAVEIANGPISATVYLPDAKAGFYRGTRFDWSGVIGRLEYAGHRYYGPWFTRVNPAVRDFVYDGPDIVAGLQSAIAGPVEEFATDGQGLGFADAAPGGTFIKIGVGALRKPADGGAYDMFRSYEIVDTGTWTHRATAGSVEFTQELNDSSSGYGYRYTKTIQLTPGEPELVMTHRLRNLGRKTIASTVYNHNFLVLDGVPPGPGLVITAPFPLQSTQPLDPAMAVIDGQRLRYLKTLAGRDRVSSPLTGFGPTAADYHFVIEDTARHAGFEVIGDRPVSRLNLWSIRSVVALEPFVAMTIEPGAEFTWTYRYRYFTR